MSKNNKQSGEGSPIRLSYSLLRQWFALSCPAAWAFDQEWIPLEKTDSDKWMETGNTVHAMLEGTLPIKKVKDTSALLFYDKLIQARDSIGLVDLDLVDSKRVNREVYQRVQIDVGDGDTVEIARKIDVVGRVPFIQDGVLADWKSTGTVWKPLEDGITTPQSRSFQSVIYLLPPTREDLNRLGLKSWPKTILYLVAGFRGGPGVFQYDYNPADVENLKAALRLLLYAIRTKSFPKVRDKHCLTCSFRHVCNEVLGWRKMYAKKEKRKK